MGRHAAWIACVVALFSGAATAADLSLCPNVRSSLQGAIAPLHGIYPETGRESVVEVGQPMIYNGMIGRYPMTVTLPHGAQYGGDGSRGSSDRVTVPAGTFDAAETYGNHVRFPLREAVVVNGRTGVPYPTPAVWIAYERNTGKGYLMWDREKGRSRNLRELLHPDAFSVAFCQTPASGGFSSQIDYTGLAGTVITLTYREFMNDWSRPAFTQDVRYDLKDGKEITFRGARIEVLQATNADIRYRVVRTLQ